MFGFVFNYSTSDKKYNDVLDENNGLIDSKKKSIAEWNRNPNRDDIIDFTDDHLMVDLFENLETVLVPLILNNLDRPIEQLALFPEGADVSTVEIPDDIGPTIMSMADQNFHIPSFGLNRFEHDPEEMHFEIPPLQALAINLDDEPQQIVEPLLVADDRADNDSDVDNEFVEVAPLIVSEVSTPVVTSSVAFDVIDLGTESDAGEAVSFSLGNQVTSETAILTVLGQGHIEIDPNGAFDSVDELQISIDYDLAYRPSGLFRVSVEIDFGDTPVARGFVFGIEDETEDPFLFDFITQFGEDGLVEFAVDFVLTLESLLEVESSTQQQGNSDASILDEVDVSEIQEQSAEVGELLNDLDTLIAETPILPSEG